MHRSLVSFLGAALLGAWCALAAATPADDHAQARRLQRDGDLPGAVAKAHAAAAAKPDDASYRFLEGVLLLDLGRDAEALDVFTGMTQSFPDLPDPYNNVAMLQARAGRLDEALASLQQALRNDPAHLTARANLGEVHLRLAMRAWQQVAEAQPADADVRRRLEMAREIAALHRQPFQSGEPR